MIPQFPEFKNIEWSDRKDVEQFTKDFLPYSDFNFVSLWSWNTREKMQLSQLHGNLVLLFYDYMTEKPFLSFIGKNCAEYTASILIEYSILHFQESCLRLIPESVAINIECSHFTITPDLDAHDYIISVPYLNSLDKLPTNKHQAARYYKRYMELYGHLKVFEFETNEIPIEECINLFKRWAKIKGLNHLELNEYAAFVRCIHNQECRNIVVAVYDNQSVIGFAVYELISDEYAMGHFLKADSNYKGLNEALHFFVSQKLALKNIRYWNYEQDLGIPQLRQSKAKYKPIFYLKKYIVKKTADDVSCSTI